MRVIIGLALMALCLTVILVGLQISMNGAKTDPVPIFNTTIPIKPSIAENTTIAEKPVNKTVIADPADLVFEEDKTASRIPQRRIPEDAQNLIADPHFTNPSMSWNSFTYYNYISWNPLGHITPGSMRITPSSGGSSEAWQGKWRVHPGDKIIYAGWFRSGPQINRYWNNGTGLGWDLRKAGDSSNLVFYTLNGPATTRSEWTYIYSEQTIPCEGTGDIPIAFWYTTEGISSTYLGARAGLWDLPSNLQYRNRPMPSTMELTVWVHIWHKDTVAWAEVDNLELYIIPNSSYC